METKSLAIGIDLGSSNTRAAVYRNNKIEIIPTEYENQAFSSVVAFNQQMRLIGNAAKGQTAINVSNTVHNVKRCVGLKYAHPIVQKEIQQSGNKIVESGSKPMYQVNFKGSYRSFYPEEIVAMILQKVKENAERYLKKPVVNSVITVPAYFTRSQRLSVRDAAKIAGLNCTRLLTDTSAACLSYCWEKELFKSRLLNKNQEQIILVVDFGSEGASAGTFTIEGSICQVKSSTGKRDIGGNAFTKRLVEYFLNEKIKRIYKNHISSNKSALYRLSNACNRVKQDLSSNKQASIQIGSMEVINSFCSSISRNIFENFNGDLFDEIRIFINEVLREAKLGKTEVNDIILLGGTSRIPKIQHIIQNFFDRRKNKMVFGQDNTVAIGAAIQAAILNSERNVKVNKMLLLDTSPYTVGIGLVSGKMEPLLKKGMPIPIINRKTFSITSNNTVSTTSNNTNDSLLIEVYEGDDIMTKTNVLISRLKISNIIFDLKGKPKATISFSIDVNEKLFLEMIDENAKPFRPVIIEVNSEAARWKGQLQKLITKAEKMKREDEEQAVLEAKTALESYCRELFAQLEQNLSSQEKEKITTKLTETYNWIQRKKQATSEEYEDCLEALKSSFFSIRN